MIHTPAFERWIGTANLDPRTGEEILEFAQRHIQGAITDSVHPMLAAQVFLAAMIACFEGCDLPKAQRKEFINDFFQLLDPVIAENARTWVPNAEGTNVTIQ
jgi:hypothetical protein